MSDDTESDWLTIDEECAKRLAGCPSEDSRARMRATFTFIREMARGIERQGVLMASCRCGRDHSRDACSPKSAWVTAELFFELVARTELRMVHDMMHAALHEVVNHGGMQRDSAPRKARKSIRTRKKTGRGK